MNNPTSERTRIEEHAAGITLVVLMVWGLWQVGATLQSPSLKDIPWSLHDFRLGHTTNGFSTHIDKKLPAREDLIAWANAGRYVLTRGAGDQVRLGRAEWLFSVEEIQYHPNADVHLQERVALMQHAAQAFKRENVALLVALVPDKARVHVGQLSTGTYPHWYSSRYSDIQHRLSQAGVPTVDLQSVLQTASATQALYYRTDTHWNQRGAQQAAQAIAAQAHTLSLTWPVSEFQTQTGSESGPRTGDLLRMMSLGDMPNALRPDPDVEAPQTTLKRSAPSNVGLLGDASMPVTLVGTSYSLRANFHGHLQEALKADVLNVAKDGGGFLQSMKDYVQDESFKTAKPQLIVWEVPERVFSAPLSDDEKKGLPF